MNVISSKFIKRTIRIFNTYDLMLLFCISDFWIISIRFAFHLQPNVSILSNIVVALSYHSDEYRSAIANDNDVLVMKHVFWFDIIQAKHRQVAHKSEATVWSLQRVYVAGASLSLAIIGRYSSRWKDNVMTKLDKVDTLTESLCVAKRILKLEKKNPKIFLKKWNL